MMLTLVNRQFHRTLFVEQRRTYANTHEAAQNASELRAANVAKWNVAQSAKKVARCEMLDLSMQNTKNVHTRCVREGWYVLQHATVQRA